MVSHQRGIPLDALSATLTQAISVSSELGFRHVWIDALCIIQDDPEDWAREAAKMCDVYSDATLTILASGSRSSSEGIFRHQMYSRARPLTYNGS